MTEWFLAAVTALWGWVLLLPDDTFSQPQWAGFRAIFRDENVLGWTMVCLGLMRIGGLVVNGARKHVTPWIRVVSAACGFLIFVGITYCYALSGVISTWLAIYPPIAVLEIVNAYRAAHDSGESNAII
ncbi:hypothetical protein IFT84_13750 [Rhizobium sp. CFBP 8762]|uniref:hypothetical protein n=1 Tax=Rhizobium sp. CFBP 8762 TaxID=2775279 RepID=UPI001781A880|nr:hypothetical protein [Rhizobium sp. CFBP 8762]MBD8555572.1 hypothetical protein [Rhizobium sp. CFBP 8762]